MDKITEDIKPSNIIVQDQQEPQKVSKREHATICIKRCSIQSHWLFKDSVFEFKSYLQRCHELFEHASLRKEDLHPDELLISSQLVSKSSQKPIVLPVENSHSKNMGVTIYFFSNIPQASGKYSHNIYVDPKYNNCLAIPMKNVVTKDDHPLLHIKVMQTFQEADQEYVPKKTKKKNSRTTY